MCLTYVSGSPNIHFILWYIKSLNTMPEHDDVQHHKTNSTSIISRLQQQEQHNRVTTAWSTLKMKGMSDNCSYSIYSFCISMNKKCEP